MADNTVFYIRISNETNLPERIKQAAQEANVSVNQFFTQAAEQMLACKQKDASILAPSKINASKTNASMLAPNPTPAVPTYTPTDPLDIVAEAFFHKPYAVLNLDSKNMCDFIADHPITGPDMVLSFPDGWIKAGIEYMNNPTPVPVYQPKPMENAEPISENLKRIRAYRAAKDEAFRQSLAELESLYPEDSDDMFYADSDENAPEDVNDYSEENSEEL